MLATYGPILILFLVALFLSIAVTVGAATLGPKRPTAAKLLPYECGIKPLGSARQRFPVKFYLFAMLFLVFDIEAAFFYPWAVIFSRLRWYGYIEMVLFVIVLLVGYFYILRKGAFEWE